MRKISFEIPIYDWELTIITTYEKDDVEAITSFFTDCCPSLQQEAFDEIVSSIRKGCVDGGVTLTGGESKRMIVVIYKWTSEEEFFGVLNHEKCHCVHNIVEKAHVNDSEATAYLDGYISKQIYKHLNELK